MLLAAGIDPAEAVKTCEVAVEGAYASTVLDGEGGQVSVCDEVSAQIAVGEELPEDVAVTAARGENPDLVGVQPVGDAPPRVRRLQRAGRFSST